MCSGGNQALLIPTQHYFYNGRDMYDKIFFTLNILCLYFRVFYQTVSDLHITLKFNVAAEIDALVKVIEYLNSFTTFKPLDSFKHITRTGYFKYKIFVTSGNVL